MEGWEYLLRTGCVRKFGVPRAHGTQNPLAHRVGEPLHWAP